MGLALACRIGFTTWPKIVNKVNHYRVEFVDGYAISVHQVVMDGDTKPFIYVEYLEDCQGNVDKSLLGRFDSMDDLPKWMQDKLVRLFILDVSGTTIQKVAGIGQRMSETVYWVEEETKKAELASIEPRPREKIERWRWNG
jgi:hypothetical protein